MCGTPQRSRTMRTGPERPPRAMVPVTCATSGGDGRCVHPPAVVHPAARSDENTKTRTVFFLFRLPTLAVSRPRAGSRYTLGMAIKDGLLTEFDHEMGMTRRLLERVPDDKLSWKPHTKSMSLGGLATHLSNLPRWA